MGRSLRNQAAQVHELPALFLLQLLRILEYFRLVLRSQPSASLTMVSDSQAVIVENLHVKGMVRNHKLAKAISDVGWGTFTNFLAYKLERKGGKLVEIDRWFPSSKLCCFKILT